MDNSLNNFITEQKEQIVVDLHQTIRRQAVAEISRCYLTYEQEEKFNTAFADYVFSKISADSLFDIEGEMFVQRERLLKALGLEKELSQELQNRYIQLSQDLREDD